MYKKILSLSLLYSNRAFIPNTNTTLNSDIIKGNNYFHSKHFLKALSKVFFIQTNKLRIHSIVDKTYVRVSK
jgi:hypothetical protein